MRVASEDPEVVRLVTLIGDTVRDNGGSIHPELVVNHEGASLWLSLPRTANPYAKEALDRPRADAPPLLEIPADLHIPVTDLDWVPSVEKLEYRRGTEHLSDAQRTILDAMVSLFNAVDKVRVVGRGYAMHSLTEDPELAHLVREARPGWRQRQKSQKGGQAHKDHPDLSPAQSVVNSRLRTQMGEGDEGPMGYFMPMIDMLNHHPYGSRYERTEEGDWLIRVHHPTPTDQVFVRYNKADALGVALGLGYFEPDTRFVASVACKVEVPDVGVVEVQGVGGTRRALPAPRIVRNDNGLMLQGLVLELARRAELTTLLTMPLMSMQPDLEPDRAHAQVESLIDGVVAANADFFGRMSRLCANGVGDHPLRPMFGQVAGHQLALLSEWRRAPE